MYICICTYIYTSVSSDIHSVTRPLRMSHTTTPHVTHDHSACHTPPLRMSHTTTPHVTHDHSACHTRPLRMSHTTHDHSACHTRPLRMSHTTTPHVTHNHSAPALKFTPTHARTQTVDLLGVFASPDSQAHICTGSKRPMQPVDRPRHTFFKVT
jgi:hypothetical protein